ncbi:MAG: hypothetical protein LBG60_15055 [Bifidobacteriaceae bacterium]|nr:hypothetical protein [Bifidobacteriaceae bacterium]
MSRALGFEPMPWQADVFEKAFEVDSDGRLWYREVVIVMPRQSGKTTLVLAWGVHRCVVWPARQRMVYQAQTREKALEKLVDEHFYHIDRSPLRRLLRPNRAGRIQPVLSHGSEHLRWVNGSKWSIDAPTETGGHGATLDLGIGDEIWAHKDARVEQAISPAMVTIPDAQKVWLSTVGKRRDASPLLWGKMLAGRNRVQAGLDSRTLYVEYSAPDDADWLDRGVWWDTMPALGFTQAEAAVEGEADSLGEEEFRRAYLCQWRDELPGEWKIPEPHWTAACDPESKAGPLKVWVIDVSPDRTCAAIGLASQREDGAAHVEVVERGPGAGWLVDGDHARRGIVQLMRRHGGELYYEHATCGSLVPDLLEAGLDPKPIGGEDVRVAAPQLLDWVLGGRVFHIGQASLTKDLAAASTQPYGDSWRWSRGKTLRPVPGLVAVTYALRMLAKTLPDLGYDPLSGII